MGGVQGVGVLFVLGLVFDEGQFEVLVVESALLEVFLLFLQEALFLFGAGLVLFQETGDVALLFLLHLGRLFFLFLGEPHQLDQLRLLLPEVVLALGQLLLRGLEGLLQGFDLLLVGGQDVLFSDERLLDVILVLGDKEVLFLEVLSQLFFVVLLELEGLILVILDAALAVGFLLVQLFLKRGKLLGEGRLAFL